MSSPLAIAAVTAVPKNLLNDGIVNHDSGGAVGGAVTVTVLPPDRFSHELPLALAPTVSVEPHVAGDEITCNETVRAKVYSGQRSVLVRGDLELPTIQSCGDAPVTKRAIAAAACATMGSDLFVIPAQSIPPSSGELDALARQWNREAALCGAALLLDCDEWEAADSGQTYVVGRLMERTRSPLFAEVSGAGKTMAAEVLAGELRLDLYRIDLNAVVSEYVGETEKNLRLVFDAAEEGGAVLLFDEADSLFGKRSEYANLKKSLTESEIGVFA